MNIFNLQLIIPISLTSILTFGIFNPPNAWSDIKQFRNTQFDLTDFYSIKKKHAKPFKKTLTRPIRKNQKTRFPYQYNGTDMDLEDNRFLFNLGTFPWQDNSVSLSGAFTRIDVPMEVSASEEDEGSILLASETGIGSGNAVRISGFVGDGPFGQQGSQSGDVDYYAIRNVSVGEEIFVSIEPEFNNFILELRSESGELLLDGSQRITYVAPENGDYFVSIAGFEVGGLQDPFDSASGPGDQFGFGFSEGAYSLIVGLDYFEEKTVYFFGRPGDVFGAAIDLENVELSLVDPKKTLRMKSRQDFSFAFPDSTLLPSGVASLQHVSDLNGVFEVKLRARQSGSFNLDIVAELPPLRKQAKGAIQTIFVDFDGQIVDLSTSVANPPPEPTFVTLSPLSYFLSDFGLNINDEEALMNVILATMEESLVQDIQNFGRNRNYDLQILNSRDHIDVFGQDNVSRVIIGGTSSEFGRFTVATAQSIDPGNFDTTESAFILLDALSGTSPFPLLPKTLNDFEFSSETNKIELVGIALGRLAAHEVGHLLGNFHTEDENDTPNIMDGPSATGVESILGLGNDRIFGTKDDVNVGFGTDIFTPLEGFSGIENTLTTIEWGASPPSRLDIILNPKR